MSVKKLSFYLTDAEIPIRSDHLLLKHFFIKKHAKQQGQQLGRRAGNI